MNVLSLVKFAVVGSALVATSAYAQFASRQTSVVYRLYNGADHMLSPSRNEAWDQGYYLEGPAFAVFVNNGGGRFVPLFRCFDGASHYASMSQDCEGGQTESVLGYISPSPVAVAHRQVVRCSSQNDHLITANVQECYNANYYIDSTLGYVP